jgi:hypothetical protein
VCGGNRGWYRAETEQILMTLFRTAYQQGVDAVGIMIDLLRSPATDDRTARHATHGYSRPIDTQPYAADFGAKRVRYFQASNETHVHAVLPLGLTKPAGSCKRKPVDGRMYR